MAGHTQLALRRETEQAGIRRGVTEMTGAGTGHHLVSIWINHTFTNRMGISQSCKRMTSIAQVNVTLGIQPLGFLCMIGNVAVETFFINIRLVFIGSIVRLCPCVATAFKTRAGECGYWIGRLRCGIQKLRILRINGTASCEQKDKEENKCRPMDAGRHG